MISRIYNARQWRKTGPSLIFQIPLTTNRCLPAPGAGHEAVDGAAPESCGLRRRHTWPDEKLYFCISEMGCGAWRLDKFSRSLFDGRLKFTSLLQRFIAAGAVEHFAWPLACREALFLISEMGCGAWRLDKISRSLFDGRLSSRVCCSAS